MTMAVSDGKRPDALSSEINTLYLVSLAMDRLMMDFERRMKASGQEFRRDKKFQFNQIIKGIQMAFRAFQVLNEDIEHSAEDKGWEVLDAWYEEGLEIVRLLLLYDDRCGKSLTNRDNLFKYLRGMQGDGVITEEVLSRFYLKK